MTDLPIEVYGINLLIRLVADDEVAVQLRAGEAARRLGGERGAAGSAELLAQRDRGGALVRGGAG